MAKLCPKEGTSPLISSVCTLRPCVTLGHSDSDFSYKELTAVLGSALLLFTVVSLASVGFVYWWSANKAKVGAPPPTQLTEQEMAQFDNFVRVEHISPGNGKDFPTVGNLVQV